MHWAYLSAKKDNIETAKVAMYITIVLGVAFLIGQVLGWSQLIERGIYFRSSTAAGVSGSFLYAIS